MKIGVCFTVFYCLIGCRSLPQTFKEELGCFKEQQTNLDKLINTQGFYREHEIIDNRRNWVTGKTGKLELGGIDTTYFDFMFLENGLFIGPIHGSNGESTRSYINRCFTENKPIVTFFQGTYRIDDNLIKVKYVNTSGYDNGYWSGFEVWYKVIDRNTIAEVYTRQFSRYRWNKDRKEYKPIRHNGAPAKFVSVENIPKPRIDFSEEKWFKCN